MLTRSLRIGKKRYLEAMRLAVIRGYSLFRRREIRPPGHQAPAYSPLPRTVSCRRIRRFPLSTRRSVVAGVVVVSVGGCM